VLKVHLFPLEVPDFAQPTPSEQQQPDRSRGGGTNPTLDVFIAELWKPSLT
jgi:hypothetical protein